MKFPLSCLTHLRVNRWKKGNLGNNDSSKLSCLICSFLYQVTSAAMQEECKHFLQYMQKIRKQSHFVYTAPLPQVSALNPEECFRKMLRLFWNCLSPCSTAMELALEYKTLLKLQSCCSDFKCLLWNLHLRDRQMSVKMLSEYFLENLTTLSSSLLL